MSRPSSSRAPAAAGAAGRDTEWAPCGSPKAGRQMLAAASPLVTPYATSDTGAADHGVQFVWRS